MTGKAMRGVGLLCLPLVPLALVSALYTPPAHAADPHPVLVYQNPREAEAIQHPAFGVQLCFASAVCKSSSGTAAASQTPEPGATTPAAVSASPSPTPGPPSASATRNAGPIAAGSSSAPDILKYALLTIGAAGAAAVILLIGYLVRRRVGYDLHREKPGGDDHH
jgi:hypothetical protein